MSVLLILGIFTYILYGISLTEVTNKMRKVNKKPQHGFLGYLASIVYMPIGVLVILFFVGYLNLPEKMYK